MKFYSAEPFCMSRQFYLRDGSTKGEKAIKKILDRLESHGFLTRQEVKKREFGPILAERVKIKFEDIGY